MKRITRKKIHTWVHIIILTIVATPIQLSAQSNLFKQTFTDAEYFFLMQDYQEALPLYQKLFRMDSLNANVNFRLGQCYLNISGIKSKAIPHLEKAIQNINPKYNEGSYKETQAPPLALFHLGEAYMVNHNLDKALKIFTEFKDRLDIKDVYNLDYVNQQIKACENAKQYISKPINIQTERFNPFPERNKNCNYPVLSADRNTMVFTVKEKFYSAIYQCIKENEQWSTPKNITLELGVEGEVYSTALNNDGTVLLLFKNEITSGNIYYSNYVNGIWQPAKKLNSGITSKDWETFASFSADGKQLLFTSNKKGGQGGLDIYIADRMDNGTWGNIRNLIEINTPYNEESPILSNDGKTLYFSSQGHNSMGGFDIFYSQLLPNNKWSTPINLGYPINTPDNEFYYFPIDSTTALMPMVSKDLVTFYEIYRVEIKPKIAETLVEIIGKLTLSDNAEICTDSIAISLKDTEGRTIQSNIGLSTNGDFKIKTKPGSYLVEAISKNYSMNPVSVFIPENFNQSIVPIELTLTSNIISQGLALKLNTILFDFDSYALTRESKFELEKVFRLMESYPELYIEVCGHTDSKGSPAYNLKLSSKRAKSIVEYLVYKGINERRFIVKGMGALSCIASNVNPDGTDNPAGRRFNRRGSIRIFSGNKSVQIDDIDIPENLKPNDLTYTILLAKPGDNFTPESIKKAEKELDTYSKRTDVGAATYINIGSFANKSVAIPILNKIIDFDLPNAMLVSEIELARLIKSEQITRFNSQSLFSVLLMTSETPISKATFKGFVPTEEKGKDGIYRYYFGAFNSKEIAQSQLEKINVLGFPNAMVVKIK